METPEKTAPSTAGAMLRETRLAKGVSAADLCASLRISTAALEAVEACQYDRLPGDPYVRALLGSISRCLNIDAQKILRAYNMETGTTASQSPAAPYQDVSEVHVLAHRKLFIAVLAMLLIALLFILAKVNSSSQKNAVSPRIPSGDTLTVAIPPPAESLPESHSLRPDSAGMGMDSAARLKTQDSIIKSKAPDSAGKAKALDPNARPGPDTTHSLQKIPVDTSGTAAKVREKWHRVFIKALTDSAGFRAYRKGRRVIAETLSVGRPREVMFRDTMIVFIHKAKSVVLDFGDTTVVPVKRRFKIFGNNLSYF